MTARMLPVTGLWLRRTAEGRGFLVGKIGAVKVLVFKNDDRRNDADPTHRLFFTAVAVGEEQRVNSSARQVSRHRKRRSPQRPEPLAPMHDDRIDDLFQPASPGVSAPRKRGRGHARLADGDLAPVIAAVQRGASIRAAAKELGISIGSVGRRRRAAIARGLLAPHRDRALSGNQWGR